MLIKAKYFGFYPLGSDITVNNIRIMQSKWRIIRGMYFVAGSKKINNHKRISVFGDKIYCAEENGKTICFAATEYGLGKYHIFLFSDKANKKLSLKAAESDVIHNHAVLINKIDSSVKIFGKYISPRDMNGKIPDSFYKFIREEKTDDCYIAYLTNNGKDEYRLVVKKPSAPKYAENYIIVEKADSVRWEAEYLLNEKYLPCKAVYFTENDIVKKKEFIGENIVGETAINFA